jgi:hypothetical protein
VLTVRKRSGEAPLSRFRFTFCSVTQGTNHVVFSGNKLLARLNGALAELGVHPVTDDRPYKFSSSSDATFATSLSFPFNVSPADLHFLEKLIDVVGLYLNPSAKALVLCIDEKSQIQTLDRTQPELPLKCGRCGTMTPRL